MKVLCIGHLAYDYTCNVEKMPEENTKNYFKCDNSSAGGFGANTSILLGKYGVETYLASCIGDDTFGSKIKEELQKNQVRIDYIETVYGFGTACTVILNNNPKRTVLSISETETYKKKSDIVIEPDIILTDSYDYNLSLQVLNKYQNKIIVLDADKPDEITLEISKRVTYIIASKDFAESITGMKIDSKNSSTLANVYTALVKRFPEKKIIVTLEDYGALYMIDNQIRVMPGIQVETKDTTGAGDVFRAGFVYGLTQNYDLEKSITFANIAAGLSTRNYGGASSIPELSEVNTYLAAKYEVK